MKSYRIVEYDYDSLPESWKAENTNMFADMQFILLGNVKGMKGHVFCICADTGKPYIFDKENVKNVEV